ncbi:MAG: ATP-binding protein [Chloroflexota bacterium]|nr:ATP-binding protein [Chloroflexota bacterium]
MNKKKFISKMLALPPPSIEYGVGQHLATLFPERALIEGEDGGFDVEAYARAGHCVLRKQTFLYNQVITFWIGPEPQAMGVGGFGDFGTHPGQDTTGADQETASRVKNAWLEVEWQGATIDVLFMNWTDRQPHHWILADSQKSAESFLAAVCKWNTEIRGEVLVYDGSGWYKDEHLFQDIQGATFDNLILRGSLKQDIRDDLLQFFASRALYDEYAIPWKRGILFVGPAGNGKTHTVKALINAMEQPCLYVKSIKAPHGADQFNIRAVFERARKTAPCILVFEDLDAQLTPQNRSFFLNELDGFAANVGIVTLATTNHPERLDPAILDRPSRFDRKYPFDLPEQAERHAYIVMWNTTLQPALRLSEEGASQMGALTEGFSFAYLKELFLSSMMRWIAKPEQGTMEQVMSEQVNVLREQMISANTLVEDEPTEEQSMPPGFNPMMRRRFTYGGRGYTSVRWQYP